MFCLFYKFARTFRMEVNVSALNKIGYRLKKQLQSSQLRPRKTSLTKTKSYRFCKSLH